MPTAPDLPQLDKQRQSSKGSGWSLPSTSTASTWGTPQSTGPGQQG